MRVELACNIVSFFSFFSFFWVSSPVAALFTFARAFPVLAQAALLWEAGNTDLAILVCCALVAWGVFGGVVPLLALAGSNLARICLALVGTIVGAPFAALAWIAPAGSSPWAVALFFALVWLAVPLLLFTPRANRWYRSQGLL